MDTFWPDLIIAAVILISIVVSFVRGFVKELLSVVSWVVAAWVAVVGSKYLAEYITFTDVRSLRLFISFLAIFVAMVFIGAIVNYFIGKLVKRTPFRTPDRIFGVVFGLARGLVIIALVVLLGGLTPFPKDKWWQESYSIGQFAKLAVWMQSLLPDDMADNFDFSPEPKDDVEEEETDISEFAHDLDSLVEFLN